MKVTCKTCACLCVNAGDFHCNSEVAWAELLVSHRTLIANHAHTYTHAQREGLCQPLHMWQVLLGSCSRSHYCDYSDSLRNSHHECWFWRFSLSVGKYSDYKEMLRILSSFFPSPFRSLSNAACYLHVKTHSGAYFCMYVYTVHASISSTPHEDEERGNKAWRDASKRSRWVGPPISAVLMISSLRRQNQSDHTLTSGLPESQPIILLTIEI